MLATNPKIFMLWPKKNNENEKKFLRLENSPPLPHNPHNVSNGPSLRNQRYGYFLRSAVNEVWRHKYSTSLKIENSGLKTFLGSVLELFTELDKLLRWFFFYQIFFPSLNVRIGYFYSQSTIEHRDPWDGLLTFTYPPYN